MGDYRWPSNPAFLKSLFRRRPPNDKTGQSDRTLSGVDSPPTIGSRVTQLLCCAGAFVDKASQANGSRLEDEEVSPSQAQTDSPKQKCSQPGRAPKRGSQIRMTCVTGLKTHKRKLKRDPVDGTLSLRLQHDLLYTLINAAVFIGIGTSSLVPLTQPYSKVNP